MQFATVVVPVPTMKQQGSGVIVNLSSLADASVTRAWVQCQICASGSVKQPRPPGALDWRYGELATGQDCALKSRKRSHGSGEKKEKHLELEKAA